MDASPDAPPDPVPPTSDVERLAPEIKALILSHLEDDIPSLRSCALVCASWTESARLYLFRRVVCRPSVPTRTWDDFFAFLTASPEVTQSIRWLTVDGYNPETKKSSDVGVEQIVEALDRIPSLMGLYIQRVGFHPATPRAGSRGTRYARAATA
ncbi:hypothetical protein K466DRAFT_583726 [Polyporus arcularius HHB13444]|uniref:Uncharacterized protein n=1 Tax=Polyporus arcularius HHB13444 TaxID=1314778 RepID=A0A5C3PKY6_9APHY|nr:hypothetical protein K466DRAFT_583726 [Polyporus arcularius HHB13444]